MYSVPVTAESNKDIAINFKSTSFPPSLQGACSKDHDPCNPCGCITPKRQRNES